MFFLLIKYKNFLDCSLKIKINMIFYIKDGFLNGGKWVHVKYINNFLILRSSLFNDMLKGLNIIILYNYTIYTLHFLCFLYKF